MSGRTERALSRERLKRKTRREAGLSMSAVQPASARLDLAGSLVFGQLLLEHLRKIDRVEHQWREAAIARCLGDDLPGEREQQSRAFDEQDRQHVLLREAADVEHAAIDQLDIEQHFLVEGRLGVQ